MYNFVEMGGSTDQYFKRHLWVHKSDISQIRSMFNNTDVYKTVCSFQDKTYESKFSCPLFFDIDSSEDLSAAHRDTKTLINILTNVFYIPTQAIRIRFSGNKGFHLLAYTSLEIQQNFNCMIIWQELAKYIKNSFVTSIDLSSYQKNRLFRLNNSINGKSGLYKIPLTFEDMFDREIGEIRELAQEKRIIDEPTLNKKYLGMATIRLTSFAKEVYKKLGNKTYQKPPCIANIEKGVKEGERNNSAFTLAIYYKNKGFPIYKIKELIRNKIQLGSPKELDMIISSVQKGEYSLGCSSVNLLPFCDKENCEIHRKRMDKLV